MLINEAVKKAMETDAMIIRGEWKRTTYGRMAIKPTNTGDACMGVFKDTNDLPQETHRCWNPKAEDLTSDDWELI